MKTEPIRGDYVVEAVHEGERFHVDRVDMLETRSFPDEASAVRYALECARLFGHRAYRRTDEGWEPLLQK